MRGPPFPCPASRCVTPGREAGAWMARRDTAALLLSGSGLQASLLQGQGRGS